MNLFSSLLQHPASLLVAVALVVLLIRLGPRLFQQRMQENDQATATTSGSDYVWCFLSGVLFTNALAHFTHGISGEQFPAPFGYALGNGFPAHLSNVLWGFLNMVLGYSLFVKSRVFNQSLSGKIVFFAGVLMMGIFLSYFFSR
jgi:cytochrome bd-type quinol oxidase subunit 2